MYERFYDLRERPFSLSPDPEYLYLSRVHREALGYVRYGIEGQAGFIVLTGDIGCGKTTLLQAALANLDRQTLVARIVNTMLNPRELVESIVLDFGMEPGDGRGKPYLLRDLGVFLAEQRVAGRLALLAVDEAQNLGPAALEELRMLSNLETEKAKLIQIILVGQPSLRNLLAQPELEQLRQRVTVSYHLDPLTADETASYIAHRLAHASVGAPVEFPRDVTDLVCARSGGIPRRINVIADAILLFGYGEGQRSIDLGLTRTVLRELEVTGVLSAPGAVPPQPIPTVRDTSIAEQERQLTEQRRVLVDEYRLLRELRYTSTFDEDMPLRGQTTWPPRQPAGRGATSNDDPETLPDLELRPAERSDPREGRWQRLRRKRSRKPASVIED